MEGREECLNQKKKKKKAKANPCLDVLLVKL